MSSESAMSAVDPATKPPTASIMNMAALMTSTAHSTRPCRAWSSTSSPDLLSQQSLTTEA